MNFLSTLEPRRLFAVSVPTPWTVSSVGSAPSGTDMIWSSAAKTFSLSSAGTSGAKIDAEAFTHQRLAGDGYISASILNIAGADGLASAGIQLRDTLTATAAYAELSLNPNGSADFEFRLLTSASATRKTLPILPGANYLKLERRKNTVIASRSADGVNWTQVASETIPMAATTYVGMVATSGEAGGASALRASATFSNVTVPQNITLYGASTTLNDNTAAIQSASNASNSSGGQIYIPPGIFKHSQVIELTGAKHLFGAGQFGINPANRTQVSELLATNVDRSPVRLTGSGGKLSNLRINTTYTGDRRQADLTTGVYATGASNFLITGVEVAKGASGGIMVSHGANNGIVTGNKVHDTLADGIHVTNGVFNITVENNTVYATGDDLIATVGYNGKFDSNGVQWQPPTNITIRNNDLDNTGHDHGRGIGVVGSKNVIVDNNVIRNAPHTGIIIVSEDSYNSLPGDNITVTRNQIINPNTQGLSGPAGNHGGIYIGGRDGFLITNVTIGSPTDPSMANTITNSGGPGISISSYTDNIKVYNTAITGTAGYGIRAFNAANVTLVNNTISETGFQGIYFHGVCTGVAYISANVLKNINSAGASTNDAIQFAAGGTYSSVSILSNSYTNPAGYILNRFIEVHLATSIPRTVTGNTTDTGKSTYVGT